MNVRNACWKVPAAYRLWRGIARWGVRLLFPSVRVLQGASLAEPGATLLVANYPESFLGALLLIASMDRPILCLFSSQSLRGPFRKLLGRGLGIIPIDLAARAQGPTPNSLTDALKNWGSAAIFAGQSVEGCRPPGITLAAQFASEAAKRKIPLALFLLQALVPQEARKQGLMIYVVGPIRNAFAAAEPAEDPEELAGQLADTLEKTLEKNVFALEPVEIKRFLRDLEEIAREDLEEQWSEVENWKQHAGDLRLSGLVERWITRQNQINPGRLVALRRLAEDYREKRRRASLGRFRIETAGPWRKSGLRAAAACFESLLGLPVALYGFVNHFAAGVILYMAGLARKSSKRDPKVEWLLRAFVVLGCYIVQVWLFDMWLGRPAAGYYALSLPLAGAYLWRYLWLAKNRSRLLLLSITMPGRSSRLRRTRKNLLGRLEREIAIYAQSLGMIS